MDRSVSFTVGPRTGAAGHSAVGGVTDPMVPITTAAHTAGAPFANTAAAGGFASSAASATAASATSAGATHTLPHTATCIAAARMSASGAVVVVAGDQHISCYFDASLQHATCAGRAGDAFSDAHGLGTAAVHHGVGANGVVNTAAPAAAAALSASPAVAALYVETASLTSAGGSIVSLCVVPASAAAPDTLFGVAGLTNGRAVPFVVVGPAHACYQAIGGGNCGGGIAFSGAAGVGPTGYLRPRIAVMPFLDLSAATSHSVSDNDAVISVAIGASSAAAGGAPEFIAAATSNCVAMYGCSRLFSEDSGAFAAIIPALFGIVPKAALEVGGGADDDNSAEYGATHHTNSAAAANCATVLAIPSMFVYKGFNVYAAAAVLRVKAISAALASPPAAAATRSGGAAPQLRRVFPSDFLAASAGNGGAAAAAAIANRYAGVPVAIAYGGYSTAVTATADLSSFSVADSAQPLEIVASAVLAVVLEDGTVRFIGRCVDPSSWGFGGYGYGGNTVAASSATAAGASLPAPARPLPSSPSMAAPSVVNNAVQQRTAGRNSLGGKASPFGGGMGSASAAYFSTSATISRSTAIHPTPLAHRTAEAHYVALSDSVRVGPAATASTVTAATTAAAASNNGGVASPQGLTSEVSGAFSSASAASTVAAAAVPDTMLNDADVFFNAATGLIDAVVAGTSLVRAAHLFGSGGGSASSTAASPLVAASSGSLLGPSASFVGGSATAAHGGLHPNPATQSMGYLSVARSIVHGSVFRPAATASHSYDRFAYATSSAATAAPLIDVDVALPTPQQFVGGREAHLQRVGHCRYDRRALAIVRAIGACPSAADGGASVASSAPQACLVAAGSELFLSHITCATSSSSAATSEEPATAVAGTTTGGPLSPPPAAAASPAAAATPSSVQYLCGFGGPIQDVEVLSVTPIASAAPRGVVAGALVPIAANSQQQQQCFAVTAAVAVGSRVHVVQCTYSAN